MAVVQNAITGKTSGSVGNVTFSTQFGRNVMKSKPVTVANPDADGQRSNRSAMTQTVAAYRQMSAVAAVGFKERAVGMSAYNAFTSRMKKNAFDLSTPRVATLVPEDVLISDGSIASTPSTLTSYVENTGVATLNWETTVQGAGQALTDKALIVVYDGEDDTWMPITHSLVRSSVSREITIPEKSRTSALLRVYVGFANSAGSKASASVNYVAAE